MFTPLIRIVLVIACLVMAFLFYITSDYLNMGMVLLAAGLFIYGYFKYGTVYAAFQQLKKENFDKAERLISKTKSPNNLAKQQKGYYHFATGMIAAEKNELDFAKSELTKALEIGLRTKNDTSIVLLNLANIEYERTEFNSAEGFLHRLKDYELNSLVESEAQKLTEKINAVQHRL